MWPNTGGRASRPAPDAPALDALHDSLQDIAAPICASMPRLTAAAARKGACPVPLPLHHRAPAVRAIARPRVEADTPGARLAWARRREAVERWTAVYGRMGKAWVKEVGH